MATEAERIATAIKNPFTIDLINLIEDWFYSDLDIEFVIKDRERKLLCVFESDVYYYEGKRHEGKHRRFVIYEGDNSLFDELEDYTKHLYTKDELIDLVYELASEYELLSTDDW